jgi:putative ABC transport system substrate-binding protein
MHRRSFLAGAASVVSGVSCLSLNGPSLGSDKQHRIGYLSLTGLPPVPWTEGFTEGLRDLGYIEGQNLIIEWRFASGSFDKLDQMARELVGLHLDVIVTPTAYGGFAVKNATTTTPIVVIASHGGVRLGLYESMSHPGGNIPGIDSLSQELDSKRVAIMKTFLPSATSAGLLYNPGYPGAAERIALDRRSLTFWSISCATASM